MENCSQKIAVWDFYFFLENKNILTLCFFQRMSDSG